MELVWLLVRVQSSIQQQVTEEPLPLEQSPWVMVGLEAAQRSSTEERSGLLNMEDCPLRWIQVELLASPMNHQLFSAAMVLSLSVRSVQAQEQVVTPALLAQ